MHVLTSALFFFWGKVTLFILLEMSTKKQFILGAGDCPRSTAVESDGLTQQGLPRLMVPVQATINLGQNNFFCSFEIAVNPSATLPQIWQAEIGAVIAAVSVLPRVLPGTILILFLDGAGLPGLEFICRGCKLQRSRGGCAVWTCRQCTATGMAPRRPGR